MDRTEIRLFNVRIGFHRHSCEILLVSHGQPDPIDAGFHGGAKSAATAATAALRLTLSSCSLLARGSCAPTSSGLTCASTTGSATGCARLGAGRLAASGCTGSWCSGCRHSTTAAAAETASAPAADLPLHAVQAGVLAS